MIQLPDEPTNALEAILARFRIDDSGYKPPSADLERVEDLDTRLLAGAIDWDAFWKKDRLDDWLCEPFLGRGRSHALFAAAKTGKSLLILYAAACLAVGVRPFVHGRPLADPVHVLYLDYEMTEDDLIDRLMDLGYGPDTDLTHLHYHPLPSLPPLDTAEGASQLVRLVELHEAEVVIVDTLGRAVEGEENSNDTVRAYYRHTASRLKALGVTQLRADHAGKDLEKGQRGGSAKNDDVDVVWQLDRRDAGGFRLRATHKRMGWIPESVELHREDAPLAFLPMAGSGGYPAGTTGLAAALDSIGVPLNAGRSTARRHMTEHGLTAPNELLAAALRYRRDNAARGPE